MVQLKIALNPYLNMELLERISRETGGGPIGGASKGTSNDGVASSQALD